MESFFWPQVSTQWTDVYALLGPRVHVKGRMALLLLVGVVWAFGWLLWRAYSVIQTPNDVLVDKLGLDIPPPLLVTLEEINSREIQVSWKSSEATALIHEHHVEVNRRLAGITRKNETAIVIYNLRPVTFYDIRVFSVSTGRFQTPSSLLHVRTTAGKDDQSQDHDEHVPAVRVLAPRLPSTPSVISAPALTREPSGGGPVGRRGTLARRPSPSAPLDASQAESASRAADDETDDNIPELSQQLQKIQQDIEGTESQIQDEEREFEASIKEKEAQRDGLRTSLKERDEISRNLKQEVNKAEAANRAAQAEKSKKERLLDQKQNERKKRKDDVDKWERDTAFMAEEMEVVKNQQSLVERKKQNDIIQIRQRIAEEQREVARIEEENREKALEIKALDEERAQQAAEDDTEETREADRIEQEKKYKWEQRMNGLRAQYSQILSELQTAHRQHSHFRERHETAQRQATFIYPSAVPPDLDAARRGQKSLRQNRHASSLASSVSSPRAGFGAVEPYSINGHFNNHINPVNSSPTTTRPSFFNPQNGMTLMVSHESADTTIDEPELLSSAPMSPRADALLPADLLGDESSDEFKDGEDFDTGQLFAELTDSKQLSPPSGIDGAASPAADSSSSPRSFASPQGEQATTIDWEQRSVHSQTEQTHEDRQDEPDGLDSTAKKPSTMSNLFSFHRQRGKTLADQPPLLGSLKSGQSQSFPRNYDEFDEAAQPRRRLSYGGNWQFPGSSLLGRTASTRESERLSASRRGLPGIFNRSSAATQNYDPFAPDALRSDVSLSRPASVYSFDKLPRPSVESQFHAWGVDKGMKNSPLAPHWASLSKNPSRRPSIGYGSTSNLPLESADDEEYLRPRHEPPRPLQAPIGTRPASSQRPSTPKLNPAAPSFTMFFSKSRDKAKEKAKSKEKESTPKPGDYDNISPPESRKSRDTSSLAATVSTYESRDSLERSTSAYSGGTPLDATPSKPTFISKITRKASANKFGSWKGQSSLFSRKDPATPTGDTEDDTSTSLEYLGKSYESMASTPGDEKEKDKKAPRSSLGGWNFMRSKSKKGGLDKKDDLTASEVSEGGSERASVDVTEEEPEDE